jgi:Ca2+-binding RTX toxin-like protein
MVDISNRALSAGFISAAGVRRGARTLSELSAAAGREVELTQANLRPQATDFNRVGQRVGQFAVAINGIEEARGVVRSADLSDALRRANQNAVNRILQAESLANAQSSASVVGNGGTASIAQAVAASVKLEGPGAALANALTRVLGGSGGSGAKKPAPLSIIANAASRLAGQGDIFERTLPTRVQAQGQATVEVARRSLEAREVSLVIDPAAPDDTFAIARAGDAGRPTSSNEGFVVKARTGERGGTLVLDLSDPNGEDGRLATVDVTGGEGSDVIMVSGANDAEVRAGGGNDYVLSEGNAVLYGGAGDDILIGNIVYGEEGDDVLFGNALAVGGVGNDRITMFSLAEDADGGLAFGGEGDDIIIGESLANADGGAGNDAISLRRGGFGAGGAGNDTLTAFDIATLEGGEGNDDLLLFGGGEADGGAGDDDITAAFYSTVRGGAGNDIVRMNTGGVYRFSKGDGVDRVLMGSPLTGQVADWGKVNRLEISDFAYADVEVLVSTNEIAIIPRDPAARDRLVVTRAQPGDSFQLTFTKGERTQTVTVEKNTVSPGPIVPVLR